MLYNNRYRYQFIIINYGIDLIFADSINQKCSNTLIYS